MLHWLKPILILPAFLPWTSKSIASVKAFTELYRHFLCLQGFIDFFPHLSTLPFTTRYIMDPLFLQFPCFTPWNVLPLSFLLLQNSITYSTPLKIQLFGEQWVISEVILGNISMRGKKYEPCLSCMFLKTH